MKCQCDQGGPHQARGPSSARALLAPCLISADSLLSLASVSSSAASFPSFFSGVRRDLRQWQVTYHSIAHSANTTVLEYTLRGVWSGRLPSMVVGLYDQPIVLRCIDTLRWDDAHREIQRVDVLMDRYELLVQIGMAKAKL